MKDELKKFIDSHREAFDDKVPSEKVWTTIDSQLPAMGQRSLWNSLVLWRAAAILFLGLSVYFYMNSAGLRRTQRESTISQNEFSDLESFYSGQIAEKVALIDDFDASGEHDSFTQEFKQLDAMYQVLREEMKSHPSNKVKDALVLNLLVRIDLLNQQIKKLEDSRKATKDKSL